MEYSNRPVLCFDVVLDYVTVCFKPVSQNVKLYHEDAWKHMKEHFQLTEDQKRTAFSFFNKVLLALGLKSDGASRVRKKKNFKGLAFKTPQVYIEDQQSLLLLLSNISVDKSDVLLSSDIVCVKKESLKSCCSVALVTAYSHGKPLIYDEWIQDSNTMGYLLSYEKYRVEVGKPDFKRLSNFDVAIHGDFDEPNISREWLQQLVQRFGGTVVKSFTTSDENIKVVVSSKGASGLGIPVEADYIVHYDWVFNAVLGRSPSWNDHLLCLESVHKIPSDVDVIKEIKLDEENCTSDIDHTHVTIGKVQNELNDTKIDFLDLSGSLQQCSTPHIIKYKARDDEKLRSSDSNHDMPKYENHNLQDESVNNITDMDITATDFVSLPQCSTSEIFAHSVCGMDEILHDIDESNLLNNDKITSKDNPEFLLLYNTFQFNQKLYLLQKWSNDTVYKTLKLSDLKNTCPVDLKDVTSFASYLQKVLPEPGAHATEVRREVAKEVAPSKNIKLEKLRAFVTHLFPPILVQGSESEIRAHCIDTCIGDILPQFTVVNNYGKKMEFKCVLCQYVHKGKSHSLIFEGIHQMYQHGISKLHKRAVNSFSSCESQSINRGNRGHTRKEEMHKMQTSMSTYLGKVSMTNEVNCYHIFDPDIVGSLKDDQILHRMAPVTLFKFREIACELHEDCDDFDQWKRKHPNEFESLKQEKVAQAMYIKSVQKQLNINGTVVTINGAIKSIFPSCLGVASNVGKHPYTCINCHKHKGYFKDFISKRKKGKLRNFPQRAGLQGMRKGFLTNSEKQLMQHSLDASSKELRQQNIILRNIVRNSSEWTKQLTMSLDQNDHQKFILDMLDLFRQKIDETNPIQWKVLQNLVGKLKSGKNHHFHHIVKKIAKMHKNQLGATNYATFKEILGFPSASTVAEFEVEDKFYIGCNKRYIEKAALSYENQLVVESSDEARVRRSLDARLSSDGSVSIIGNCWNPDPRKWPDNMTVPPHIPGCDQFSQLEKQVKEVVETNNLATHVSIHNFNSVTERKPTIVFSIWPTPNKGYTAEKLYQVQQDIRRMCSEEQPNIALIGHSTDSAGYSLSLAVTLMTPNDSLIIQGIKYLGLGIPEEKFLAPYFWKYPSIYYLDFEHNQRSSLRQLKYTTLDLILYLSEDVQYKATIDHITQLREVCIKKNIEINLSENDLILLKFFDQNSEAAYKVFNPRIAELLDEHVPEAHGTALYCKMIHYIMSPYYSGYCGTPCDIVESVASGQTMLRLWKRSAILNRRKLTSKPGASSDPNKRGNFITNQTNNSLEIQCHASIHHQLALFLHRNNDGIDCISPRHASTIATEKFIGQTQAKTSHIQSLNTEPSAAEIIDRASQLQYNFQTQEMLMQQKVNLKPTTGRKRTMLKEEDQSHYNRSHYFYPSTFEKFKDELKEAYYRGVRNAQELMNTLPSDFKVQLQQNNYWIAPFSYDYSTAEIVKSPPSYDKINVLFPATNIAFTAEDECECPDKYVETNQQKLNAVVEETQESDDSSADDTSEDKTEPNAKRFYVQRNGEKVHVQKALKLALGSRDIVRKDRFAKHWATKHMPNYAPLPETHDIILLNHYFMRTRKNRCQIIKVISIEESGKRVKSTESKSKTALMQGVLYDTEGMFEKVYRAPQTKLTRYFKGKDILFGVKLQSMSDHFVIQTETRDKIIQLGYYPAEYQEEVNSEISDSEEEMSKLDEGEYLVEKIVDMKLNDAHEYEYLVKWKGYSEKDNQWLPGSAFKEEISFTLKSRRGRNVTHTIIPGESAEHLRQKRKKLNDATEAKKPQENNDNASAVTDGNPAKKNKPNTRKKVEKRSISLSGLVTPIKKRCVKARKRICVYESDTENDEIDYDDYIRSIVCPWGGESDGTKLHNTCTIDSVFSCLFILYKESYSFQNYLCDNTHDDLVCDVIHQMFDIIHDGKNPENWTRARKIWLSRMVEKDVLSQDVNVYGNEQDLLLTFLNNSKLGQIHGTKEWICNAGCGNGKTSIKLLNVLELLERWAENSNITRKHERTDMLPLLYTLNEAVNSNGCEGRCRKCPVAAKVKYTVREWPPLLLMHVYDFIRKYETYNSPSAIPDTLSFSQNDNIIRYKVLMVTLFRRGHFCGAFNLKGSWWLYDPFSLGAERISRIDPQQSFPGECVINFLIYVKAELL